MAKKPTPKKRNAVKVLSPTVEERKVKTTGYWPPPAGGYKTKAEALMEGGALDCMGNLLRVLEDYDPADPVSYVSIATDPKYIRKMTLLEMEGITAKDGSPVQFVACDVGGAIKGPHIDICVRDKAMAFKVTKSGRKIRLLGVARFV